MKLLAILQRFKQLTTDRRLTILVTQEQSKEQRRNVGRRVLLTLQEAVQVSRSVIHHASNTAKAAMYSEVLSSSCMLFSMCSCDAQMPSHSGER